MDQEQQHLVRASFAKVTPGADATAAMFYDRLFAADPTLRSLFKGDMVLQGRLLMTMIATAVENVQLDGYCRPYAIWGGATWAMASRRRTTTRLPPHCSGRCSRRSVRNSLRPYA